MKEIKAAAYEGYLWYSDENKPKVFLGDKMVEKIELDDCSNPFVVEGNLWNAETHESIMIRYIDGRYFVRHTVVADKELLGIDDRSLDPVTGKTSDLVATTVKEYLPHRLESVKALRFLQYWQGEEDAMCEGMAALRPSKLVFVGFNK